MRFSAFLICLTLLSNKLFFQKKNASILQPKTEFYNFITIEQEYVLPEDDAVGLVHEDEPTKDSDAQQIKYDAVGVG